jgi:hypothetical protein
LKGKVEGEGSSYIWVNTVCRIMHCKGCGNDRWMALALLHDWTIYCKTKYDKPFSNLKKTENIGVPYINNFIPDENCEHMGLPPPQM